MPASTVASVEAQSSANRHVWRRDAAILAAAAVLIRVPSFFATRHITFDDGVFGSSALAMRAGQQPFKQIFSPQGPLFLPLVWLADVLGFRTLDGPRLVPVLSAAALTVATYAIGRRVTTRYGAVLAAVLVTTSGSVLYTTAPITSDGPALALSLIAVACAFAYRTEPSTRRAVFCGLALGAALSIKALVLPAAVPIGLLLLARRRAKDCAAAVGAAVAVGLAATLPWGFTRVWDQSIAYHQDAKRIASYAGNASKIVSTLCTRDLAVVVFAALALVTFALTRRRPTAPSSTPSLPGMPAVGVLALWLGAQVLFLMLEPAMWRPHLAHLIAPIALLAALSPPPGRVLIIAAVLVAPLYWLNARPMLRPPAYRGAAAAVERDLRRLPSGALAISDEPGFLWRAGVRTPGFFVDGSVQRIQQGDVTAENVARRANAPDVCAVLVWSNRYNKLHGLPERLGVAGYRVKARYGGTRVLYERRNCRPA